MVTDVVDQNMTELAELCRRYNVQQLELFGSAAGDNFDAHSSDLDFLVDFRPLPPAAHSRAYFDLWFGLQDLFGRHVDLIETPAVTNPYFLRSIHSSRQVVYAA